VLTALVTTDRLNLQVSQSDELCSSDTISLTPSGAETYVWEMDSTILSTDENGVITVAPTENTTYMLTGTNASGCEGTLNYTVEINQSITYQLIEDIEICTLQEINLLMDFSGDFTNAVFDWSSTDVDQNDPFNPLVTPMESSTYSVMVTDQNGCTFSDEVNINFSSESDFRVAVFDTLLCADELVMFSIEPGFTSVNVDGPLSDVDQLNETDFIIDPVYVVSGEIMYTVRAVDNMGCTVSDSFTINFLPNEAVNIITSNNTICIGDSVTLTIEGNAGPFTWQPAINANADGTEAIAFPTETTTYYAMGPPLASCNALDSITIIVTDSPPVTIVPETLTFCPGITIPILVNSAESYVWDSDDIVQSDTLSTQFFITPSFNTGSMEYNVTVTFENGCKGMGTLYAEAGAGLTIDVIADNDSICMGNSVEVLVTGANEYMWTPDVGEITPGEPITLTPDITTTYQINGLTGGCSGDTTFTTTVLPIPELELLTDSIITACSNETIQLGVSGADSYEWGPSFGDFFIEDDITLAEPTVLAVTNVYNVIGRNEFGCSDSESVSVQIIDFMINAGEDATICQGQNTPLSGYVVTSNMPPFSGGVATYTLLWESSEGAFSDPTTVNPTFTPNANVSGAINISLTAEDDLCGSVTDNVILTVIDGNLNIDAGLPITVCEGELINLDGDDNGSLVTWTGGNGQFENPFEANTTYIPQINETGMFNLYIQSLNDCGVMVRDSVLVDIQQVVNIITNGDQTIFEGESVQLLAEGGASYEWFPPDGLSCTDCPNPVASPLEDITYFVVDPSASQCSSPANIFVNVEFNAYGRVWVPNAFSPNSDGQNDELTVTTVGVETYKFTIWNRYGQKVFETTDVNAAWDGSFNEQKQPVGVFVWHAEYTFEYAPDKVESSMGNVTLIR